MLSSWLILCGLVTAIVLSAEGALAQPSSLPERTEVEAVAPLGNAAGLNEALAHVSRVATPSVVSISIPLNERDLRRISLYEAYLRYYGLPSRGERLMPRMIGSGVFISDSGFVVTNNHVVEGGNTDSIVVTTSDGESYMANLIGRDPFTDIALLRIYGKGFPVPHFANSDSLRVGSLVVAVGNPFGLRSTVTQGIVSALDRGEQDADEDGRMIRSFVQIDAAINPGNSGGGLFDIHGHLVGINTAIFSRTGDFAGYAFAIPSNIVGAVIADLIDDGIIDRVSLGIEIINLDDSVAAANGFEVHRGVFIKSVDSGSTAELAGVRANDVIVAARGRVVRVGVDLQSVTVANRVGDEIPLTIWRPEGQVEVVAKFTTNSLTRNQKKRTSSKKEEKEPENAADSDSAPPSAEPVSNPGFLGITAVALTDSIATRNGIAATDGLLVSAVDPFGAAFKAGVLRGDVLLQINGNSVHSSDDLEPEARNRHAGDPIEFAVVRNGNRLTKGALLQPGR